jgi:hypothetical protein
MRHAAFLVLSLPEWTGWLEQRELRGLAARVRWLDPTDGAAFKRLLDTAPFIDVNDEEAFVIARLQGDFMATAELSERFDGGDVLRLPLRLVMSFHAVSERAKSLLEIDAEKWRCRVAGPLNVQAWEEWCEEQVARLAHGRGTTVARFFCFSPSQMRQSAAAEHEGLAKPRALQDSKRAEHEQCGSLGWAEAFAHCRERLGDDFGDLVAEGSPVSRLVRDRKKSYALTDESFVTEAALAAADHAENLLLQRSAPPLAVLPTAAFHHFAFFLSTGKPIDERLMRALGNVLSATRIRYDDELAGLLAYEIGRLLPEARVAVLEKHLDRDLYPALEPSPPPFHASDLMKLPDGLDVRRRIMPSPVSPAGAEGVAEATKNAASPAPQPEATSETRVEALTEVEEPSKGPAAAPEFPSPESTTTTVAAPPKKRPRKKKSKEPPNADTKPSPADTTRQQPTGELPLFKDHAGDPVEPA